MAATNINRVVITGNLTRDPELRATGGGTPVCSLRVAVNSRRKDESGNWVDKPNYFDVTVWGAQGENCAQYLAKGRPVAVDGRLNWREWEDTGGRQAADGGYHCRLGAVPGISRCAPEQRRGRVRPPRRHLGLSTVRRGERRWQWGRRHPVLDGAPASRARLETNR